MNVKDVISAVVTTMKPTIDASASTVNATYGVNVNGQPRATLDKLFVSEKIKLTYGTTVQYGTVHSINEAARSFIVQTSPIQKVPPTTISVVLGFHHGRPLEIVNTFKQIAQNATYNLDMFPAICLFHDFPEVMGYERSLTLQMVIITDTSKHYTTAERYTNSFDPILTPLYDLFLKQLAKSDYVDSDSDSVLYFEHTRWDRPYWGKDGIYGAVADIFNDFIDAIEIENLKLKILKTC